MMVISLTTRLCGPRAVCMGNRPEDFQLFKIESIPLYRHRFQSKDGFCASSHCGLVAVHYHLYVHVHGEPSGRFHRLYRT